MAVQGALPGRWTTRKRVDIQQTGLYKDGLYKNWQDKTFTQTQNEFLGNITGCHMFMKGLVGRQQWVGCTRKG